jgi:cardiolipin synthase
MKIQILVDYDAVWESVTRDIRAASSRAYVQTFSFEGDRVGRRLAEELGNAHIQDRRILVDSFAQVVVSDRFLCSPINWFNRRLRREVRETQRLCDSFEQVGGQIKYRNPLTLSPLNWLRRDHKKLIVIDDRLTYIGGLNFSEHNAAWHDLMLRVDDPEVAAFFCADFLASWAGERRATSRSLPNIEMHALDGRSNAVVFDKVMRLIDEAQSSIFVESPYITFPFFDHLRDARRRGLTVTVVTPENNNWRCFGDYAQGEASRNGLDLRLYQDRMSHLKAMLIDDRCLIVGSSNFDLLSYHCYQEILAFITDEEVIADFRELVIDVDLRNAVVAGDRRKERALWARFRLKLLNRGLELLFD